jgi:hypothetical protein
MSSLPAGTALKASSLGHALVDVTVAEEHPAALDDLEPVGVVPVVEASGHQVTDRELGIAARPSS